jgi:hypothetical protein
VRRMYEGLWESGRVNVDILYVLDVVCDGNVRISIYYGTEVISVGIVLPEHSESRVVPTFWVNAEPLVALWWNACARPQHIATRERLALLGDTC